MSSDPDHRKRTRDRIGWIWRFRSGSLGESIWPIGDISLGIDCLVQRAARTLRARLPTCFSHFHGPGNASARSVEVVDIDQGRLDFGPSFRIADSLLRLGRFALGLASGRDPGSPLLDAGFLALEADVHGRHPWRRFRAQTAMARVSACASVSRTYEADAGRTRDTRLILRDFLRFMAGAAGFEPANDGTKNRCLTTWRRPNARGAK